MPGYVRTRHGARYHVEGCPAIAGKDVLPYRGGLSPCEICCAAQAGGTAGATPAASAPSAGASAQGDPSPDGGGDPSALVAGRGAMAVRGGAPGMPGAPDAGDIAEALRAAAPAPRARIDEATEFSLRLSGRSGQAFSLSDMMLGAGHEGALYDAIAGCEWDAQALADVLNGNARLLTTRGWEPVRTLPRALVVRGKDPFGNTEILRLALADGEPDACEGTSLRFSLTNQSRVPLSIGDLATSGHDVEHVQDYLYGAADEWGAEAFAAAANRAYEDGVIYECGWRPLWTRDDRCCIVGRDGWGNERRLVIKR